MARIMIENLFKRTLDAETGKTLLSNFQDNAIDWMHACGGKGRCTTCKVILKFGAENLAPLTPAEEKYFRDGALAEGERLACQAKLNGDVTLIAPREYQLPHITYSDEA